MSCLFQRTASPHAAADLVFRTFLIYLAYRETVNVLNTWLLLYDYCYCTFMCNN